MQLDANKTYTISGQAIATIASVLQTAFPRSQDAACRQIEQILSQGLAEVPEPEQTEMELSEQEGE